MTNSFNGGIADVTIANGGTTSRSVRGVYEYDDATCITIQSPAALTGTVGIQVSQDASTYAALHDGTAVINAPAAGQARQYTELLGWKYWRLVSGSAEGAERTFKVTKQWTT